MNVPTVVAEKSKKDAYSTLYLTLFCKLYSRAVERFRFVILEESLLSSSTDHAQKFKDRIKKDVSSMTIPASFASFRT